MSVQNWRDEYFHQCGRHGIPVHVATRILRHANTVQRAAEVECSVSDLDARAYWAERGKVARERIRALLVDWCAWASMHGDPRGAVVKILPFGFTESDAQWSIAVPSSGFTGAQINRLCALAS